MNITIKPGEKPWETQVLDENGTDLAPIIEHIECHISVRGTVAKLSISQAVVEGRAQVLLETEQIETLAKAKGYRLVPEDQSWNES